MIQYWQHFGDLIAHWRQSHVSQEMVVTSKRATYKNINEQ